MTNGDMARSIMGECRVMAALGRKMTREEMMRILDARDDGEAWLALAQALDDAAGPPALVTRTMKLQSLGQRTARMPDAGKDGYETQQVRTAELSAGLDMSGGMDYMHLDTIEGHEFDFDREYQLAICEKREER